MVTPQDEAQYHKLTQEKMAELRRTVEQSQGEDQMKAISEAMEEIAHAFEELKDGDKYPVETLSVFYFLAQAVKGSVDDALFRVAMGRMQGR